MTYEEFAKTPINVQYNLSLQSAKPNGALYSLDGILTCAVCRQDDGSFAWYVDVPSDFDPEYPAGWPDLPVCEAPSLAALAVEVDRVETAALNGTAI